MKHSTERVISTLQKKMNENMKLMMKRFLWGQQ